MEVEFINLDHYKIQSEYLLQTEEEFLDKFKRQCFQSNENYLCYNTSPSSNQKYPDQQLTMIPLKKSNGIKKIKQKHKNKQFIIKEIASCQSDMHLSTGLILSSQGILKFGFSLGNVSFGYAQTQLTNFLQNNQIFQIIVQNVDQKPRISIEQALEYIQHTPCKMIQEANIALVKYKQVQRFLINSVESVELNKELIQFQNEEFQKHIDSCIEYIKKYSKENENQMFQYSIGRINFQKKDVEMVQAGYSKSFLELIGVNEQSLSSMLLRNQKIELIKDQDEIMRQSLIGLTKHCQLQKEVKISIKINTFDGFDIVLHQTKKQASPLYKAKKISNLPFEYIFSIAEIDVDLEDLKNLISYRQKILSNKMDLTFDEFINKELSLFFEDVEYSVYSQSFVEKYYQKNLKDLQKIEETKIKVKNQQRCGYKAQSSSSEQIQIISK
ncbi:hypothetical protein TTHERM_01306890 (macronuclear) [Tetrahymena thermophila SB210]|uniref:Uncharacterized protein n=1 Tax=Tetrahymena thermophila (strain SB210) TaxID=312017 RepID=Q24BC6_TETTS|nr:hypothetical protein TTHERM_01306890 [Tetrahymena thermophila SB210]EAS05085.1 hypothetical protein TTHERM_01306890 [Tetrahymena thermophila SB210]|eukprot:XP_001025330.1 hypothetical protein TTHERM_01306890 [Tetrahymena thermophila SB210]